MAHTLAFPEWLGDGLHEEQGVGSRASNHLPASPNTAQAGVLRTPQYEVDHAQYTEGDVGHRPVAIA